MCHIMELLNYKTGMLSNCNSNERSGIRLQQWMIFHLSDTVDITLYFSHLVHKCIVNDPQFDSSTVPESDTFAYC